MIVGARIQDRLVVLGMSQSELARRCGLTQGTIAGLLSGRSRSSSYLHVIARELETTPAYLSGETDDPEAAAPDEPSLDSETRELIDNFLLIGAADRRAVAQLVQSLAGAIATSATVHAPRSTFKGRGGSGDDGRSGRNGTK